MDTPLTPGAELELDVERPVAGGRMLARHEGQVVLVAGAIPGERVLARVERQGRGVVFASVTSVRAAAASRRPAVDPACGGHVYAHITYAEHAALKRAVLLDALARGRVHWDAELPVHASHEQGYRMRARLHVRGGCLGFFREGTHEICPAATTGQLLEASGDALERFMRALPAPARAALDLLELSENVAGDERAVHLVWRERTRVGSTWLGPWLATDGVTGVSISDGATGLPVAVAGTPTVSDPLAALVPGGHGGSARLRRHAPAFFQANRHLLESLVATVVGQVGAGPVIDLYAGVGLFALSIAASRGVPVTAVEGDLVSGIDLTANAAGLANIRVERTPVERFLGRMRLQGDETVIVDPPRTGMSRVALDGVIAARPARLLYVSCDVATLARDLRRLLDAGYTLRQLAAFDLFPNTAHIETVAVLEKGA